MWLFVPGNDELNYSVCEIKRFVLVELEKKKWFKRLHTSIESLKEGFSSRSGWIFRMNPRERGLWLYKASSGFPIAGHPSGAKPSGLINDRSVWGIHLSPFVLAKGVSIGVHTTPVLVRPFSEDRHALTCLLATICCGSSLLGEWTFTSQSTHNHRLTFWLSGLRKGTLGNRGLFCGLFIPGQIPTHHTTTPCTKRQINHCSKGSALCTSHCSYLQKKRFSLII